MDDELTAIASAGAATMGTAIAADAWWGIRTAVTRALKMILRRRRAADARVTAAEPQPKASSEAPHESTQRHYRQLNISHGGDVFAVQHGTMNLHPPAGQPEGTSGDRPGEEPEET